MYIVILGAGEVGSSIAAHLVLEKNDITVVDINPNKLEKLQARLDIQTVCGGASYPDVLMNAGIQDADMLIAVTNSDEINMIACQIAYSLFKTPVKVARIRSSHYTAPQLFSNNHIPVDVRINPEHLVTSRLMRLIDYPGTEEILDFYHGEVLLASLNFSAQHPLVESSFDNIKAQIKDLEAFPAALYRNKKIYLIQDDFILKPEDQIYFLSTPFALHQIITRLGYQNHNNYRIIIGGGGHIGGKLARNLENRYQVKLIEQNLEIAKQLANTLEHTFVLEGDIADSELLIEENIQETDVFCAVTNEDEANIMSCLQAKHLGAKQTIALINRKTYVPLIEDSPIDHAISPELITVGHILTKVRRGHMLKVHRLQNTTSEIIEVVLMNRDDHANLIQKRISQIEFPEGCHIVGIIRDRQLSPLTKQFKFKLHDHLIILVLDKTKLSELESLFQLPSV
jgi:trk system potassium uptake protein TrkA